MDGLKGINSNSPPSTPNSFSRPRPRPPRSPSQAARIRVQNRRREYLERNPKYFTSSEQEFADPDLYDKFVRKFQTPAEREAEGRSRGWGKTLESSLMRGEARLERIASSYTGDGVPPSNSSSRTSKGGARDTLNFSIDSHLVDEIPDTKEEARAAWDEFLRERFVRGGDEDFDYIKVDGDEDLDSLEHMDREEAYFDEEEPEWADDSAEDDEDESEVPGETDRASGDRSRPRRERVLLGQTGIQDY
ncbi:hypothetical protein N0V82_002961 [Gnomoniopsis sp. IMI 355080]|nr:hypothetical protein N0V82_002961 [Gnomoniopsis sp. IMI 355080]